MLVYDMCHPRTLLRRLAHNPSDVNFEDLYGFSLFFLVYTWDAEHLFFNVGVGCYFSVLVLGCVVGLPYCAVFSSVKP